jgi:hypothetical protein
MKEHRCPAGASACLGDEQPAWSPDGRMIAFVGFAQVDPGFSDIFVVNADGTGEKRLTYTQDFEWSPSWQPIWNNLTAAPVTIEAATGTPAVSPGSTVSPAPAEEEPCLPSSPATNTPSPVTPPGVTTTETPNPTAGAAPVSPTLSIPPSTHAASPQGSEPVPSARPNSNKCKPAESDAAITAQAAALIALACSLRVRR